MYADNTYTYRCWLLWH